MRLSIFTQRILCLVGFFLLTGMTLHAQNPKPFVIPELKEWVGKTGDFVPTAQTRIVCADETLLPVAQNFADDYEALFGVKLEAAVGKARNGDFRLVLKKDKKLGKEGYSIQIGKQVVVSAPETVGVYWATRTLLQMSEQSESRALPQGKITDWPDYAVRGFMMDCGRKFIPMAYLKDFAKAMAYYKMNTFQIHLNDNGFKQYFEDDWDKTYAAFRLECDTYPGLTARDGHYTKEEFRDFQIEAAEDFVEIIPEIDIPAHSNAALAAYPEYACPVVKEFIGVLPGLGGRNAEVIFCAGNDRAYTFLQDVLDEVMALFPSRYIHLGGDEANKSNWQKCPLCQARIRHERLKDEEALQGYFMGRMADYVRSHGKEVIGWDELTNSQLPEESIILGWQGFGKAALKAAAQGHRFIMAPARVLYLIRYQGPQWFEPTTYFGNNTLKNVYDYEPVQADWKPEYEPLLMGVQACMWTEFCSKPDDVFYLTFPRLAALAETAWVPKGRKDWTTFLKGLDNYLAHLAQKGIVTAHSMYNIQHSIHPTAEGKLAVSLECERPDVEVRYTTDGSQPNASSTLYKEIILADKDITIKAATFANGEQMGELLVLPLAWNRATAKPLSGTPQAADIVVNGLRGSLKQTDFEWYTGDLGKDYSLTIDLQQTESFDQCTVGCVTNYGMAVHKPRRVIVEVSDDNQTFKEIGRLEYADSDIFQEGNFIEDLTVATPGQKGRYVRFTLDTPGNCPDNHVRPGQPSRVYIDEIIIN